MRERGVDIAILVIDKAILGVGIAILGVDIAILGVDITILDVDIIIFDIDIAVLRRQEKGWGLQAKGEGGGLAVLDALKGVGASVSLEISGATRGVKRRVVG